MKVLVAQSCLTLCNPMDCSLPGSSVLGILWARILEWVAIPFSRGFSWFRDWTQISWTAGRFFTIWATRWVYFQISYTGKFNLFILALHSETLPDDDTENLLTMLMFLPRTGSLINLNGNTQWNSAKWIHPYGNYWTPWAAGSIVWALSHHLRDLSGGQLGHDHTHPEGLQSTDTHVLLS